MTLEIKSIEQLYCPKCTEYMEQNDDNYDFCKIFNYSVSKKYHKAITQLVRNHKVEGMLEIYGAMMSLDYMKDNYYSSYLHNLYCEYHNTNGRRLLYTDCTNCFDIYYKIMKVLDITKDEIPHILTNETPEHICSHMYCEIFLTHLQLLDYMDDIIRVIDVVDVMQKVFCNRTKSAANAKQ